MTKVLLIEDDSETAEEITAELADRGFEVEWSANGIDGLDKARSSRPDAMIVDRLLPGMDGLTVIEALRKDQVRTPVLVLSALGAVDDRVRGLRGGADDYVSKPFDRDELLARIEGLLRRAPRDDEPVSYTDAYMQVDFVQRTLSIEGRDVPLTRTQYNLLEAFVRHPNQVLSQEQLLELAWEDPYAVARDQVKLYVGYLRKKLGEREDGSPIETVRGFGYRFRPPGR